MQNSTLFFVDISRVTLEHAHTMESQLNGEAMFCAVSSLYSHNVHYVERLCTLLIFCLSCTFAYIINGI